MRASAAAADVFQWRSQTKEAKEVATSTGVYTVQCTEGTSSSNEAESKRLLSLSSQFRLRQASAFTRYRDLYATRRAALILADNSHIDEQYVITFPARAAASVAGCAESSLSCSRYMPEQSGTAAYVMQKCVTNQYKAMKVPNGVYSTLCVDGVVQGQADTARVAGLATEYRAGLLSKIQTTQAVYNCVARASKLGLGCDYEEAYFQQFPSTAAAMTGAGVNGSYAAKVVGTLFETGGNKGLSVKEQLATGVNVQAYWPGFLMRPAVEKEKSDVKFWTIAKSPLKSYAYMSAAAVSWGTEGQGKQEIVNNYVNTWAPGWQPTSSLCN